MIKFISGSRAVSEGDVYESYTSDNMACCDKCELYGKCNNESFVNCVKVAGISTQWRAVTNPAIGPARFEIGFELFGLQVVAGVVGRDSAKILQDYAPDTFKQIFIDNF